MLGENKYNLLGDDSHSNRDGFGETFQETQKPRKTEARHMAKKIIKDLSIIEAPINLKNIIEHVQKEYNLHVVSDDLSDNISGMLVKLTELEDEKVGPTFVLGFNKNDPWCRRRFTIGHEIGHLLFGTLCSGISESQSSKETECHCFAAELLMPKTILKKDFEVLQNIPELAKKYLVSEYALSIKLGDDGLLKF